MKKFGMVALGLAVLTVGASADEAALPTRAVKITTSKSVTTMELPVSLFAADSKYTTQAKKTIVGKTSLILQGDASVYLGNKEKQLFKISADQITLNRTGDKFTSLSLKGSSVIQLQQDGKQTIQIAADDAVLETALVK